VVVAVTLTFKPQTIGDNWLTPGDRLA